MDPDRSKFCHNFPDQFRDSRSIMYRGYWIPFCGAKRQVYGVDIPPPYSAKVVYGWSCTSGTSLCFHGTLLRIIWWEAQVYEHFFQANLEFLPFLQVGDAISRLFPLIINCTLKNKIYNYFSRIYKTP